MVKSTNFPKRGTTNEVGGIISASSKKNTVSDSKIEILKLTCEIKKAEKKKRSKILISRKNNLYVRKVTHFLAAVRW